MMEGWKNSHARQVVARRLCEIDQKFWDPLFSSRGVWIHLSDAEKEPWLEKADKVVDALLNSEDSFRMMVISSLLDDKANIQLHPQGTLNFLVKIKTDLEFGEALKENS